jgi:hypothetical protein
LPDFKQSEACLSQLFEEHLSNSEVSETNLAKSKFFSEGFAVFDWIDFIDECQFDFGKRHFGLFVAHPDDLIVVYFEIVGEGEAVVDGDETRHFLRSLRPSEFLDNEHVGFVAIAVEDSEIEDGYFVYLADIELMRAEIANNIIIFHKLLKRAMFGACLVEVAFLF